MTSNVVLKNTDEDFQVVGTRPIRHDGYDKVTGKALYGNDMHLPSLLHGKILRSPHAHARVKSIDTSKAEAHPDVRAVLTSKDFPPTDNTPVVLGAGPAVNLNHVSSNILAKTKVLYKGHAVAAVVATNPHAAEEALRLITVEYEPLSAATKVRDAIKPDAEPLHDEFANNGDDEISKHPNVASHIQFQFGDLEAGFAEADVVIEREFDTDTVHQGYIEPHAATAWWNTDDKVTVWCSSQGHFPVRERTAGVLGIPSSKIKVVPMEIGGGFGGKTTIYLEPIAALLSKKTGHPVKMAMSRADVLEATGPTSGSYMKVKMGATRDGRLTAAQATLLYEAGAFPGSPVGAAANCIFSPYNIENLLIDGYDIVNNKPKIAAYRAPGAPGAAFASETVIDELAKEIGMDPLDFRLQNAAKEGTRRSSGLINPRIGCVETVEAAKNSEHYKTPIAPGPYRGRGVAAGFWMNGSGPACANAHVNFDGTVNLNIGTVDIGGTRPAAAQMLAEVLGIPVTDVNPQVADTDSIGFSSMTGGSSVAFKTGWASYEAAQDVKRQMLERAAQIWEASTDDIELVAGVFQHKSDSELKMTFKELAGMTADTGGPVVGRANINPVGAGSAFAVNIVDVEVDPDTGKVTILKYTAIQDAGRAIHPSYVEGQIQGGAVQGIGWALNEEYYMSDQGVMRNSTLLDYRMPTALDLPMIDTIIVEVPNPGHPFGVRGVGEVSIVPPLAALANAIHDATGVRMRKLPMNPQSVHAAIQGKNGS